MTIKTIGTKTDYKDLANKAKEAGIPQKDINLAIETIKRLRNEK